MCSYAAEARTATASGAEMAAADDADAMRRLASPGGAASAADPRAARVYAAAAGLASVAWLCGRAIVVHQRSLVERTPSAVMWRRCVALVKASM